ncbi:MAG TPA: PaaI family thioesterase [Geminicoccaceae bacterium]|nr:PaaI family thioesterase [Geminicoccaceae bacterium]
MWHVTVAVADTSRALQGPTREDGETLSKEQPSAPRITAEAFQELAWQGVPLVAQLGWRIERFAAGDIAVRLPYSDLLLRPGGTICGPALMALADITLYGLVLSMIGRVELAVTTNLNVHFLSRPAPRDVIAEGRILKLGRRLAVGEVVMRSDGDPRPICHATGTYAIPPAAG